MPSIVNPTGLTRTFGGTQVTATYNNSGADLIVTVGITSTSGNPNFSSLLYNGVAMTQVTNASRGSLGYREATFYLVGAAQGNNTLTVNLNNVSGNPCQIIIAGVDGSAGLPTNVGSNGLLASPHTRSLTVSQDSIIWAYTSGFQPITDIENPQGTSVTRYGNANTNRYLAAGYSATLNAGAYNVRMESSNQLTNVRVEIEDDGGGGPVGRRRIIIT
jgi:hypothetical protein